MICSRLEMCLLSRGAREHIRAMACCAPLIQMELSSLRHPLLLAGLWVAMVLASTKLALQQMRHTSWRRCRPRWWQCELADSDAHAFTTAKDLEAMRLRHGVSGTLNQRGLRFVQSKISWGML